MVSSARQAITCIFLVLGIAVCNQAQTTTKKAASASISGKVTIKGKPAVRVMVLASDQRDRGSSIPSHYRARTDQTGSYRITNLPAGTYEISPITPALVPANQSDSVVVSQGEEVEDVNLLLVPGGVITGKITDSEGEPLIGQPVTITPVLEQLIPRALGRTLLTRLYSTDITDDRGVYRAFGLPPGKYKVSVGEPSSGQKSSREYYKQTFYPSVTDAAKATVIEVTEGSETNNVDIVLGRPIGTFRVAGRVVDGETGRPVPNVRYGVGQRIDYGQSSSSSSSTGNDVTNANGEFRLENVTPGRYTIFTAPPDGSDIPAASVTFEVVDRDLTDLLIKAPKGSSLSGVVVLDGNERALTMLSDLQICAAVESTDSDFTNPPSSVVGQDGSFRINGVRSGSAHLWLCSARDNRKQFEIVRVENNGIPSETINVKAREHVAGIRVIVKYLKLTGAIRGQVKVENGELPPASQLWFSLWPLDENLEPKRTSSISSPELDARGRFFVEGLPAGTYRVSVSIFQPGRTRTNDTSQQVTVTDDTVTEVTLIIKSQPNPN
jgi:protocatechuate 3,4-dioxygenase beta subunit